MNNAIKKIFSFHKCFFIVITFVCSTNILSKQIASVQQERKEEAERAGIQTINLREREINQSPDLYTQTQAHAQIKRLRTLIQETFGDKSKYKEDKVVPFFDIISRMVTKEAELKDTHYVFYHATATMFAVLTDLFTQLHFEFYPEDEKASNDTFRFLRWEGKSRDESVHQFVEKEMRVHGLIDDKTLEMMALLLSVNLSLFGSVGSETESTWKRFVESTRSIEDWQQEALEKMMNHFGVTQKYNKEIFALDDIFATTPEALLMQIFIPKGMVDKLVYLAWIRGLPATDPIMEWIKEYQSSEATPVMFEKGKKKEVQRGGLEHIGMSREKLADIFKKEQDKNPLFKEFIGELQSGEFSAYAFLRAYCSTPSEVPYLNDTQGRILVTKEGLLNPSSGIKFYSYFSTPREKQEEYTTKLNAIVKKLIAEKEGQTGEAPQLKPTAKPVPSPIKTQPSPVVMPKQAPTQLPQQTQGVIARPLRAIQRK